MTELRLTWPFPSSFRDYPPTYPEAVQTDGMANGYFSQQPSTGQSALNMTLHYNVKK